MTKKYALFSIKYSIIGRIWLESYEILPCKFTFIQVLNLNCYQVLEQGYKKIYGLLFMNVHNKLECFPGKPYQPSLKLHSGKLLAYLQTLD